MPSDALFGPGLTSERMDAVVSDHAWLQAMLDVEAALATSEAVIGVVPTTAADAIAARCKADEFDLSELGVEAAKHANPVVPMVRVLRSRVGEAAADYVHWGATSQDILDTAMMLIARNGIDVLLDDLGAASAPASLLADRHRATLMAGRTLMQQASVTTFGLKAAGWVVAVGEARDRLIQVREQRLAVQFGGAVGTLASLGDRGLEVQAELARQLKLQQPVLPWHTNRVRIAELGSALAIAAGVAGKIALDAILLGQTEIGEVEIEGGGASSTMPQKSNPVDAVEILAAVRGANAQAGILLGAMLQEHERAAGGWQAEWPAVTGLLAFAGGATSRLATMLQRLQVEAGAMARNLDLTQGLILSERLVGLLSEKTDRVTADRLVRQAVSRARSEGRAFRELLTDEPEIMRLLGREGLDAGLEPKTYLGMTDALIDRALNRGEDRDGGRG